MIYLTRYLKFCETLGYNGIYHKAKGLNVFKNSELLTKYHMWGHLGSFSWNLESAARGRPLTRVDCRSLLEPVSRLDVEDGDGASGVLVSAE